jgi:hypothetical protein
MSSVRAQPATGLAAVQAQMGLETLANVIEAADDHIIGNSRR